MKKIIKKIILLMFKILYIFPIKNNKIYLMSFDGTNIGFDSKAFMEWLYDNKDISKFEVYWGFKNRESINVQKYDFIKPSVIKSISGIFHILTSKVIIYNINPPSYIPYRKKQILVNTWHGGGSFKKCGKFLKNFDSKQFNLTNVFLSESKYGSSEIIRNSFEYSGDILEIGVPRNDIFFNEKKKKIKKEEVLKFYDIEDAKKIVLYEPTFRNDFCLKEFTIDFKKLINTLNSKFGDEWILIYRLHPMISSKNKITLENAIDASLYPDNQDLLCTADILITDYSSCMWDFSLDKKPVFLFVDDIDEYEKNRGFYISYKEWPYIICKDNSQLINNILNFNNEKYLIDLNNYFNFMGLLNNGNACEKLFSYLSEKGFKSN